MGRACRSQARIVACLLECCCLLQRASSIPEVSERRGFQFLGNTSRVGKGLSESLQSLVEAEFAVAGLQCHPRFWYTPIGRGWRTWGCSLCTYVVHHAPNVFAARQYSQFVTSLCASIRERLRNSTTVLDARGKLCGRVRTSPHARPKSRRQSPGWPTQHSHQVV